MTSILTTCTRDCPGSCSIIAHVENGKILKLQGNPKHDVTAGFLCKNTAKYLENYFYSDRRILHPLLKVDGKWERISWDEALDIAATKMSEVISNYGSNSILYYQGFGARTALQSMNRRFFNLLGGVTTTYGTVCGGIGHAAMTMDFGEKISHDPLDHLSSEVILLWGRNPAVTDVHLWRILKKAKRNGATLVVLDPVKTKTANHADIFLQPKPGSDHYLAMALAKIILTPETSEEEVLADLEFIEKHTTNFQFYSQILDEYSLEELSQKCGIEIPVLKKIARLYASSSPSSILTGWGVHRYVQGHLAFRMIDALAAITGNIGIKGGGVSQGFEEYEYFDFSVEKAEAGSNGRKLPMPQIGEAILQANDPPIKLIFLASGNPVNLNPNSLKVKKGFKSAEFVIMIDHFLNDTSDVADLFLPATTFLEEEDLMGSYGHNWVSPLNPVVTPQGETKSEFEIFQLLSEKMGFEDEMSGTPGEWLLKIAAPILNLEINFEDLKKHPQKIPRYPEVPFSDFKFKTKTGKFEFIDNFAPKTLKNPDYPLRLLSTMHEDFVGSTVPEMELEDGLLEVEVHPDILVDANLNDGDKALIESNAGQLIVKLKQNSQVRKEYLLTYKGGWLKHNKCVNVLTPDIISEIGDGTPYYDTWVRLKSLPS